MAVALLSMPNTHNLLHAKRFKPETVRLILAESLRVQQIADRWVAGVPKKVKVMEENGTLLQRLREQADVENRTISAARTGGQMMDVPDNEILALHEIPQLPDDDVVADESLASCSDDKSPDAPGYKVLVIDMFHYGDPEEEMVISGFPSMEAAREYARRRTRNSVEELRSEAKSPEELRERWFAYGEDCVVIQGDYAGGKELDYFIQHPATEAERDWESLTPS